MDHRNQQSQRIRNMLWMVLLSILLSVGLGGYWFAEVVDQLGEQTRKQTVALLELEEVVSSASLTFARQTQEWKDMLLRAHDAALFDSHHQAMQNEAVAVQQALNRAKAVMQAQGVETTGIVSIEKQEQVLLADYADALARVDLNNPQSYRQIDEQVRGKDRALRDGLARLQSRLRSDVTAKIAVLGEEGREWAVSSSFIQIGLLAILLPLLSLFAFFRAYRAVREIGRSDARARIIYESIGDAVLVADTKGLVDTLNEVAQKLTGWSQQEAYGKPLDQVFQLFDGGTQLRVKSPAEMVLLDGCAIPMSNGMVLRRRDGSEVAVEDSASPVRDENDQLIAVVMVFHDVSQRYAMVARLRHERALFRQTFDQASVGIAQLGMNGKWLRVNRKLCEITGYSTAELLELGFQKITHPDDLEQDVEALRNLLVRHTKVYETEKRYIRKDGSLVWIGLAVSIVWKEDGTPDYGISIIQDIQARKDAERTAATTRAQYQALFEQMPEGVLLIDEHVQVIAHNREALRQLEYDSEALLKLHVWDFDVVDDPAAIEQRKQNILQTGRDDFESRYRTRSGRVMDVDVSVQLVCLADGRRVFQTLFHDITQQKLAAQQIEHLAYHDLLTGLANRRLLQDRIDQAIGSAVRRNTNIAVCYLDLDHFKDVNDSLGHQAGDLLLQLVSRRLLSCIRTEDTLARVGGDEFVIMLNDIADSENATAIAQKIIHEIAIPYTIGNEDITVTPSIGISICPQDGWDSETLLKHADSAMYQAKQSGRATYRFYTEALHQKAMERLKIERLLRRAIENDEFELHYQPQVDLQTGQIVGCEALIRWNQPDLGQVSPAQFIPVAEHSNLIVEIGEWVMREVCRQARVWHDQGANLKVSFNVSARQFIRPDELLRSLRSALADSGVNPILMEIELTESLLLDPQGMSEVLNEIRALGINLALDDFGTGYSSLSYLRRFPIHILKIDQSFVSDADHNANDAEMVKTIIGMAHNLRMSLVAEGVETAEQALLLKMEGCEVAQGYFYSRPVPVNEFNALLIRQSH
jgi:diguanylate cyclase (GGDEF)-like protein/PAS domain S-box-containing protein